MTAPRLVILGQLTVDDVVPAAEDAWRRRLGGNALYTAAGARLVLDEAEIGVVSRLGTSAPDAFEALLADRAFASSVGQSHAEQIVEWLIYEPDGARRTLPRNADLRRGGTPAELHARYLARLEGQSPAFADVPETWRDACAFHLATQLWPRHEEALRDAPPGAFVSLDPSRHYARASTLDDLAHRLGRANAVLPSEQEIGHLAPRGLTPADATALAMSLHERGLREVVVKLGAAGCVVAAEGRVKTVPSLAVEARDPTGAGDAFCGAYAATRVLGRDPFFAAHCAVVAGALVARTEGVEAALDINRHAARASMALPC